MGGIDVKDKINKFLKTAAVVGLVVAGTFNIAAAREVTVDGFGMDRESAIKDARRNAVEED